MKSDPKGNKQKLFAAIIIAIVLILTIGIAVSGWQNEPQDAITPPPQSDNEAEDKTEDENKNNNDDGKEDEGAKPEIKYINYLTGLQISENIFQKKPYAFLVSTNAPTYGISTSDLFIEIPTEKGDTRFLMYSSDISSMEKIGAFAPTRDYISQLTKAFGGILVAKGCDDLFEYNSIASTLSLDLSKNQKYTFVENSSEVYSSDALIEELLTNEKIDTELIKKISIPYVFAAEESTVVGKASASVITLPYAPSNNTSLIFNSKTNRYTLMKNGSEKIDMLTGEAAEFTNAVILFADSTTYEKSEGVRTVINTLAEGRGYYATGGKLIEIKWYADESGNLSFTTLSGEILTVNRGNFYIGYYKSSEAGSVTFK